MRKPVWKVVTKKRTSCIIKSGKYSLVYKKNKIVKSKRGTIGIFCFKTKKQAFQFNPLNDNLVLKVIPIGKAKTPQFICDPRGKYNNKFDKFYKYKNKDDISYMIANGTICYSSIKVLE